MLPPVRLAPSRPAPPQSLATGHQSFGFLPLSPCFVPAGSVASGINDIVFNWVATGVATELVADHAHRPVLAGKALVVLELAGQKDADHCGSAGKVFGRWAIGCSALVNGTGGLGQEFLGCGQSRFL